MVCQTKGSRALVTRAPTQPVYRCMVSGSSVRAILAVRIWNQALMKTMANGSALAQPMSPPSGRTTSSTPTKPPITSSHWTADTRSRSRVAPISVTASGVNMRMAVNSPTGICCSATKPIRLNESNNAPRSN